MARHRWMLVLALALIVTAIIGLSIVGAYFGGGMRMRGPRTLERPAEFQSNGERIYYSATSASGDRITFSNGPHWLYMHGGSCVDCHGPGGRGGIRVPMTNEIAPDIRYGTLTAAEHEDHGEEHPPYTRSLIERAIPEGLDPAGKRLHWAMPRWRISDRDLDDLIEYLKALDGG